MSDQKLVTLKEFQHMNPRAQGYVHYMQAELPGSKLPKECPYPAGSSKKQAWDTGAMTAVLEVQDMEE